MDGASCHVLRAIAIFFNCSPLPYKFRQLAIHKNMSGSHMISIKCFHWAKLVQGKIITFISVPSLKSIGLCNLHLLVAHVMEYRYNNLVDLHVPDVQSNMLCLLQSEE